MGLKAYHMLQPARQFRREVYSWYPETLTAGLNDKFAHFRSLALSLLCLDLGERDPDSDGLPFYQYFGGRAQAAAFRTAWNDKRVVRRSKSGR